MIDVTSYLWIVWLVVIFIFVIIELLTLSLSFMMLAVGSLGGLAANLLGWDWWVQIGISAILSVLLIYAFRPALLRSLRKGGDPSPSNIDALIGMNARVLSTVSIEGGLVKLANGETWTARLSPAAPPTDLEPGDVVHVATIDGSTAVVVPLERTPHA